MNIFKYFREIATGLLLCTFLHQGMAQEVPKTIQSKILMKMDLLRQAHLNSDPGLADTIYHPLLILNSQSGKKYDKETALKNLENKFEMYRTSDIEFLQVTDGAVLVNYINERKYGNFEKGVFRVTAIWVQVTEGWKIISIQSSRIKKPTKN